MQCPNCKTNVNEDAAFCQTCGYNLKDASEMRVSDPKSEASTSTAVGNGSNLYNGQQNQAERTKLCARCKAPNPMENAVCTRCGLKFGEVARTVENGKNVGFITCSECGAVYQVKKNIPFVIVMGFLALIVSAFGLIGLVLSITFARLAIAHLIGKLDGVSVKKCSVCGKSSSKASAKAKNTSAQKKRDAKIALRKENALTQFFAELDKKYKIPLWAFKITTGVAAVMFYISIFIPGKLDMNAFGTPDTMLFGDAIFNFNEFLSVFMIIILILLVVTEITASLRVTNTGMIPLILGAASAILEIIFAIASFSLKEVELSRYVMGERITISGTYSVGGVPFLIILAAILLFASVLTAYMIAQERRFAELKAENK